MHDGQLATCIFCRIASGKSPAHFVHRGEQVVAFLDIHPIRTGHVQIVPRRHFPYFDDLPMEVAREMLALGQRLARSLKHLTGAPRVSFCFTGSDVPHAHAHVIPLHSPADITSRQYIVEEKISFRAPPTPPEAEMAALAATLAETL